MVVYCTYYLKFTSGYLNKPGPYLLIRSISVSLCSGGVLQPPSSPTLLSSPPSPIILFTYNDCWLLGDNGSAIINIFPRSSHHHPSWAHSKLVFSNRSTFIYFRHKISARNIHLQNICFTRYVLLGSYSKREINLIL